MSMAQSPLPYQRVASAGNSLLARRQGDNVALFSSILLSSRKHNNGFVGNKYHFRNLYINSIIRHGKTDTRLHPNNQNAISLECYYALHRLFVRIKIWLLFSALISNGGTSTVIVKGKSETVVKYYTEKATYFNSPLTRQIWYASLLEYSSRQVHKQHHPERCQNIRVTRGFGVPTGRFQPPVPSPSRDKWSNMQRYIWCLLK